MGRQMILGLRTVGEAPPSDPALGTDGSADGEGSERMLAPDFDPPPSVARVADEHEKQRAQIHHFLRLRPQAPASALGKDVGDLQLPFAYS